MLESETASCKGRFDLKASDTDSISVSFVTVAGNRLIVGEYRHPPQYVTLESHYFTTASGEFHGSLAIEFALSDEFEYGINPEPKKAYTICDNVQGAIYEYDEAKLVNEGTVDIIGKTLPLYSLDSVSLVGEYRMAPMSEEIAFADGKLYVMYESACNKYLFGNLIDGRWCYATDLEEMKNNVKNN